MCSRFAKFALKRQFNEWSTLLFSTVSFSEIVKLKRLLDVNLAELAFEVLTKTNGIHPR